MTKDKFIHVVKRNNQRLYMLALSFTKNHFDSEDIIQNVFLKLWKYGGEFENDDHIDKWLTRVCINESKNYIKLSFRKNITPDDANDFYTFDSREDHDVFNAVMSLPKKERSVIHLFYYEDMSVKEMAKMLDIKESSVKTRLHRARQRLKNILGDEWADE